MLSKAVPCYFADYGGAETVAWLMVPLSAAQGVESDALS